MVALRWIINRRSLGREAKAGESLDCRLDCQRLMPWPLTGNVSLPLSLQEASDSHVQGIPQQLESQTTALSKLRSAYATRQENKEIR
jgi:hypothetical protein